MWIKTVFNRLVNTDNLKSLELFERPSQLGWAVTDPESSFYIACGTKPASKEDMQTVLDRIARALAAGLPFLDLGKPEEEHGLTFAGQVLRVIREPIFSEDQHEYVHTKITALVREPYANLKRTKEQS